MTFTIVIYACADEIPRSAIGWRFEKIRRSDDLLPVAIYDRLMVCGWDTEAWFKEKARVPPLRSDINNNNTINVSTDYPAGLRSALAARGLLV